MALDGRRPRRRGRRWVLLAFVLTLVVLAVNAAVSSKSSAPVRAQETLGYLDSVRPLIERSTQQGADIADARVNATTLGRDGVLGRIDRVQRDSANVLADVRKVKATGNVSEANDLLLAALAIRAQAVTALRQGLGDALGTAPPATAVSELVNAGRSMAAGDEAYQLFLGALPKTTEALPPSQWAADTETWTQPALTVLVSSLRNSFSQTPVHDVQVMLVTVEPASVGIDAGNAVLPPAKNLRVSIVVANIGNDTERHVTVSATLSPAAIGPTDTARDFVDLAPGQRRTVVLGTLRPATGPPSAVVARIDPVPGETSVADNEKTFNFVMR
jgi:hypothetical protein